MRLMILTDAMVVKTKPTAYGKVAFNIFKGIKDKHQVAHQPMLGANKLGLFTYSDLLVYPSGDAEFGEDILERNCFHMNADAVLTLKDLYVFSQIMQQSLEWIPYVPIDHSPISPGIIERLKYAFKVVSMSEFGHKELKKEGVESTLIPHGVGDEYRQHEDREMCRRRFHVKPDEFVIGFVGLNRMRKMIPRVIQVIAATRRMNPDVNVTGFFWTDVDSEVPLKPIILAHGMNEYIHWPNPEMYKQGIPENLMVELYNVFDVTICVGNEGFWMPGPESLATGTPIITPDYAAAADRVGRGCGYKVKVKDWTYNNPVGVRQPIVDIADAARKITKIINGDREKIAKRCLSEAKKYRWSKIIEEHWLPFLEKCETELRPLYREGELMVWDQELG